MTRIFSISSLIALALSLISCESREQNSYGVDGTPLNETTITVADAQYNSLTFEWNKVDGAVEYGYKLTDTDGNTLDGGLTKLNSVKFEDLTHSTQYTFHLYAYASVTSDKTTSKENILAVTTPFWAAVNATGSYTSALLTTTTWEPTLVEERAAGKEGAFGTFTLQSWYNHEDYDLLFTVNDDNSINVLNGTVDENGWVLVLAGPATIKTNIYVRNGVLIDLTRCSFDRENQCLILYTKSTRTTGGDREGEDVFTW